MADNSGSNTMLGLILGGLLVFVILVFAYGWWPTGDRTVDVDVSAPKAESPAAPKAPPANTPPSQPKSQ